MRTLKEYALYKGDELLDIGTAAELAERRGVQKKLFIGIHMLHINVDCVKKVHTNV